MNAVSNKACLICISHASYFGTPTELAIALGECKEKAIRLQAEIKLLTDDALKTSAEDDRLEKIRERAEAATPGGELFARLTQECDNCYTPQAQLLRACTYHEGWLDGHGERDPYIEYLLAEVERLRDRLALFAEWYRTFLKAVGYSTYACQLCGADAGSEHAETCALEAVVDRMASLTPTEGGES